MVHDWSATTSTPQRHTGDRRHSCFRVVIRPRPRNTCWRRSDDADACAENRVALLLRPPSAAPNSSLSATAYIPVAGGHSGKHATWLRQRRLDRPPGLSYSSPAVSPQRSCAANFQLASLRPCPRRSHQPSLAACSWAHQVKSCHPGLQGPPRLCTVVPWPVYLRCRPTKSPRASLFLQRLPRSASGSPFHCRQPSIFGCWPSGMELLATGGHVGTISDNLPHSTPDVSVYWVISWHSAHLTFCLHTVYSGPSSVLNT